MKQRAATETRWFFFAASGWSCQSCLLLLLECYSLALSNQARLAIGTIRLLHEMIIGLDFSLKDFRAGQIWAGRLLIIKRADWE
ncbi:hypothetical protein BH18ACI2_BH18ACI2_30640 [soil metagenome]